MVFIQLGDLVSSVCLLTHPDDEGSNKQEIPYLNEAHSSIIGRFRLTFGGFRGSHRAILTVCLFAFHWVATATAGGSYQKDSFEKSSHLLKLY